MVLGVPIALLIWLVQRTQMPALVRTILCVAAVAAVALGLAWFGMAAGSSFLGSKAWYDGSPWREIFLLVLMMAGMAARYFTSAIEDRRERLKSLARKGQREVAVPLTFDVWEFSYPFLFSVVTFGSLLGQIKDQDVSLTTVLLSFQTGFFWQTLLKRPIGAAKSG